MKNAPASKPPCKKARVANIGTRADFYVGRGKDAEWIGSIAWDGDPACITRKKSGTQHERLPWPPGEHLFDAADKATYRARVAEFFEGRDDVTLPKDGWPWAWENSNTTDYAYAFDKGKVWVTYFGHGWWPADAPPPEKLQDVPKIADWPNMKTNHQTPLGSQRSGLMVFTSPK